MQPAPSQFQSAAPATQLRLPLHDPRYRRPMMPVAAVKGILDITEDQVIELVEVDLALWAWNIANPDASRREVRILTQSVARYQELSGQGITVQDRGFELPQVLGFILGDGNGKPWLTGVEVQRKLNCGSTLVLHLVESRALALLDGTDYRRGPSGSPCITRQSFIRFLETRIIS
jgi:hypothetical protein